MSSQRIHHGDSSNWGTILLQSLTSSSVCSGILGATASCLGKCAFDTTTTTAGWVTTTAAVAWANNNTTTTIHPLLLLLLPPDWMMEYATRGVLFLAMLACNALMVGTFVRGLEEQGSITGSAVSTAANFCTSAFLGAMVWKETFTSLWWIGLAMIFVGMLLLTTTTTTSTEGEEDPSPPPSIVDKKKMQ